jgi:hypothetical protein
MLFFYLILYCFSERGTKFVISDNSAREILSLMMFDDVFTSLVYFISEIVTGIVECVYQGHTKL